MAKQNIIRAASLPKRPVFPTVEEITEEFVRSNGLPKPFAQTHTPRGLLIAWKTGAQAIVYTQSDDRAGYYSQAYSLDGRINREEVSLRGCIDSEPCANKEFKRIRLDSIKRYCFLGLK